MQPKSFVTVTSAMTCANRHCSPCLHDHEVIIPPTVPIPVDRGRRSCYLIAGSRRSHVGARTYPRTLEGPGIRAGPFLFPRHVSGIAPAEMWRVQAGERPAHLQWPADRDESPDAAV